MTTDIIAIFALIIGSIFFMFYMGFFDDIIKREMEIKKSRDKWKRKGGD